MKRFFSLVAAVSAFVAFAVVAHGEDAVQRPIEDFVDTQGTFCFNPPTNVPPCLLFVPPIENFLGQSDPANGLLSSVDYAGLADEWVGGPDGCGESFGTTFSGTVRERPLADGRAEVHVVLHTRNALTWVTDGGDFNNELLFGYRAPDVCDGIVEAGDVALGSITLIIDFINTAPGDPLPDLLQLLVDPQPGQQGPSLSYTRARARGPLRPAFGVADGTTGRFFTTQNGVFMTSGGGATADGFPVERISLRVVGGR